MTVPKRFALSTLLLVMLLVSLVFGYAQWRRQWLTEEIRWLNLDGKSAFSTHVVEGFDFRTPTTLAVDGSFWLQVVDQPIRLVVFKNRRGEYHFEGEEPRPVEEMKQLLSSLESRLHGAGFTRVDCAIVFPRKEDGSQLLHHFRIESLGIEVDKRD
jgi:hypothetical protein